jgi:hypothetical protein
MGLAAALPILFLFGLALVRPWTDRKGWTKTRGRERELLTTALQGWNLAVSPELNAAVEYQKACHDEEDHAGGKRRPYFPGITNGRVTVRPLEDTPADLAALAEWAPDGGDFPAVRRAFITDLPVEEVPCLVIAGGLPAGYLQFAGTAPGVFRIGSALGQPGTGAVAMLTAYLFEFEEANRVIAGEEYTRESFRPEKHSFHLLMKREECLPPDPAAAAVEAWNEQHL